MAVGRQHCHLVALLHAHLPQGIGQAMHTRLQMTIGIAPPIIDHRDLVREQTSSTAQKVQRQERLEHGAVLSHCEGCCACGGCGCFLRGSLPSPGVYGGAVRCCWIAWAGAPRGWYGWELY